MKKRIAVIAIIISLMFSLSACAHLGFLHGISTVLVDNGTHADNTAQQLVEAISNQNVAGVRSLFSDASAEQTEALDEQIKAMFSFIQGDVVAFGKASERGVGGGSESKYGKRRHYITASFHIETTSNVYYIAFRQTLTDSFDWDNIGVTSIYIISAEDWPDDTVYRGNSAWTPGINIDGNAPSEVPGT